MGGERREGGNREKEEINFATLHNSERTQRRKPLKAGGRNRECNVGETENSYPLPSFSSHFNPKIVCDNRSSEQIFTEIKMSVGCFYC